MEEQNIIFGRYEFDIKPDMYSDLILEEALGLGGWLERKLLEYGIYINNIIKNIGYAYQNKRDGKIILENLLNEYIDQINFCNNYKELSKILDTIYVITYTMPLLAEKAVIQTLTIFTDEEHPLFVRPQKVVNSEELLF